MQYLVYLCATQLVHKPFPGHIDLEYAIRVPIENILTTLNRKPLYTSHLKNIDQAAPLVEPVDLLKKVSPIVQFSISQNPFWDTIFNFSRRRKRYASSFGCIMRRVKYTIGFLE
tara:strand:+ start:106043 stop:106384 length:342 start_codon:yes stop_codon:yes gene_type:complete